MATYQQILNDFNQNKAQLTGMQTYAPQKKKQSKLKSLLQFGVPLAGSIAGAPLGPAGMVGGGALGAGLLNYLGGGREGESPLKAAGKDSLYSLLGLGAGRVAGPIIGKLLGKGAGEVVEQAGKTSLGTRIKAGVAPGKHAAQAGLAGKKLESAYIKEALGMGGSAVKTVEKETAASAALKELLEKELAESGGVQVPLKTLASNFDDLIKNVKGMNPSKLKALKQARKELLQISNKGGVTTLGDLVSEKSIYTPLVAATSKETPSILTPENAAIRFAHKALTKTINDATTTGGAYGPIRTLNILQGGINPIVQGAEKAATAKTAAPFVGTMLSPLRSGVQGGQYALGQGIDNASGSLAALSAPGAKLGGQIGAGLGAGFGGISESAPQQPQQTSPEDQTMGQPTNPRDVQMMPHQDNQGNKWLEDVATGEILSEDSQWRFNKQINDWEPNTQLEGGTGGDELEELRALARQDLANGGKNLAEIAAYMKIAGLDAGAGAIELSDSAIKIVSDLQNGIDDVRGLQADFMQEGSQTYPGRGLIAKLPFASDAKTQQARINRVKQSVGKALEGGVLRKEDENKYREILATINDPETVSLDKLVQLEQKLTADLTRYVELQQKFGKGRSGDNLYSNLGLTAE